MSKFTSLVVKTAVNKQIARLSAGVAMMTAASFAMAQAADPFTTALADATGKVSLYAAALVGLGAIAVGFMIALKYVKKISSAS
jgi:hypothetical protein